MYIRTDYEISLCPAIRLAGGRSAENGPNLRQIQVTTTSNRLYGIYYEVITTLSRLLSETLVMVSEVYEALIEAGASEAKAKAAAEATPASEQLATKQDLVEVKASLEVSIAALEAKVRRAGIAIAALAVLLKKFLDWVIR